MDYAWNSSGKNTGVVAISFPGNHPNPGVEPASPSLQAFFFFFFLPFEPLAEDTHKSMHRVGDASREKL